MENFKITPWIPLIQTFIKYGAILIIFLFFKDWAIKGLETVTDRIGAGSSFKIGTSGLELGEAPIMDQETSNDPVRDTEETTEKIMPETAIEQSESWQPKTKSRSGNSNIFNGLIDKRFYLIHAARKINSGNYEIKVALGSHNQKYIKEIKLVRYYLHDSFQQPVREITNSNNNFQIILNAWGQFEIQAEIEFKDSNKTVKLSRFLNF